MKKFLGLLMAVTLMLSLCACGVKLTDTQKAACDKVDELFNTIVDKTTDKLEYSGKAEEISGKIVYISTLDFQGSYNEETLKLYQNSIMPIVEDILHEEDMYFVLYLNENGEESYRVVDSDLDPSVLN